MTKGDANLANGRNGSPYPPYSQRIVESIAQITGLPWNEMIGIVAIFAMLGATGLTDYAVSKTAAPNLPLTLEANGTMALAILGVFMFVYKMRSVRLDRAEGEDGPDD